MVADMQEGQRLRREPEGTKSCRMQGESVRPSVLQSLPFLPPALQRLTQASQRMAQASSALSKDKARRPGSERPGPASEGHQGGMDGRTYVITDVEIPPVFYRTSSHPAPSGAAAQKLGKKQGKNCVNAQVRSEQIENEKKAKTQAGSEQEASHY